MSGTRRKDLTYLAVIAGLVIVAVVLIVSRSGRRLISGPAVTAAPPAEATRSDLHLTMQAGSAELEQMLTTSIVAAADYLARNQLSNGELPYRVFVPEGNRGASPSVIRLVAGSGSLYATCQVAGDDTYCQAADRALALYLNNLIDGDHFPGVCLYGSGRCSVGGNALAIDAIYKRWQATGSTNMNGTDLMRIARDLGENTAWMQHEDGSLSHAFDPFPGGEVDPEYFVVYFNGESLMAWLQLYEMTGEADWLERARALNAFMLGQPVLQDHWHAYSFMFFANLDTLTAEDAEYATQIAEVIIADQARLLADERSAISTATKVEALASIAVALARAGMPHEWLAPELEKFAAFMLARQLPANLCGWSADEVAHFEGGIYRNCEDPYIRVDANQHWINGAATYLEYLRLLDGDGST